MRELCAPQEVQRQDRRPTSGLLIWEIRSVEAADGINTRRKRQRATVCRYSELDLSLRSRQTTAAFRLLMTTQHTHSRLFTNALPLCVLVWALLDVYSDGGGS